MALAPKALGTWDEEVWRHVKDLYEKLLVQKPGAATQGFSLTEGKHKEHMATNAKFEHVESNIAYVPPRSTSVGMPPPPMELLEKISKKQVWGSASERPEGTKTLG